MATKAATGGKGFQPVRFLACLVKHNCIVIELNLLQDSDVHVTFEDQQKINRFAKHNARLEDYKRELEIRKNELKSLEEACEEIELFDEDEMIPFQIGEVFISHNLPKTQVNNSG